MNRQEQIVLGFFQKLDVRILDDLDEEYEFSFDDKHEFIEKMNALVTELKAQGYKELTIKETSCKFCYPNYKAFELFDLNTGEFVSRYIVHKNGEASLLVDECSNERNSWTKDLGKI